jgi:hypothetical protein
LDLVVLSFCFSAKSFDAEQARLAGAQGSAASSSSTSLAVSEHTYAQPKLFRGSLKSYQVWV